MQDVCNSLEVVDVIEARIFIEKKGGLIHAPLEDFETFLNDALREFEPFDRVRQLIEAPVEPPFFGPFAHRCRCVTGSGTLPFRDRIARKQGDDPPQEDSGLDAFGQVFLAFAQVGGQLNRNSLLDPAPSVLEDLADPASGVSYSGPGGRKLGFERDRGHSRPLDDDVGPERHLLENMMLLNADAALPTGISAQERPCEFDVHRRFSIPRHSTSRVPTPSG